MPCRTLLIATLLALAASARADHGPSPMHRPDHGGPHMRMTPHRPATPAALRRAAEISSVLRRSIARYRDYRVAIADGYRPFLENVPLPEHHFTNYRFGFLNAFWFDEARPTSLLYRKTPDGWELQGAMYTAPKNASLEELNDRFPLSVAQWHAHVNICLPPRGQGRNVDWTKFGPAGWIATADDCDVEGGRFLPQMFGWMVHIYPWRESR
jgi:hypothetical protein